MANSIIDGTDINTNLFMYSAPKAHESGGKVVNVYNKLSKKKFLLCYNHVNYNTNLNFQLKNH